jgi:hypothetical protein
LDITHASLSEADERKVTINAHRLRNVVNRERGTTILAFTRSERLSHPFHSHLSTMSDQEVINLTLDKALEGDAGPAALSFCITKLSESEWDCFLVSISLEDKPLADGLELSLAPKDTAFKGDQTWALTEPRSVVVEDEEENEVTIQVHAAVCRGTQDFSVWRANGKGCIRSGWGGSVDYGQLD